MFRVFWSVLGRKPVNLYQIQLAEVPFQAQILCMGNNLPNSGFCMLVFNKPVRTPYTVGED